MSGTHLSEIEVPKGRTRLVAYRGRQMEQRFFKWSDEMLDYLIDLARWLSPDERIIGCQVGVMPDTLAVQLVEFSDTTVVVWLRGGADQVRHEVECDLATSAGRSIVVRFVLFTRGAAAVPVVTISIDSITIQVPFTPHLEPGLGAPGNAGFGALSLGRGRELIVTLTNTGNQPLIINAIGTTGDFIFIATIP